MIDPTSIHPRAAPIGCTPPPGRGSSAEGSSTGNSNRVLGLFMGFAKGVK